ncbi:MAG: hypothetical protein V3V14_02200, partial [Saprospiraceae bacterium]
MANSPSMTIFVDAGTSATLCYGETLQLADLDASISGDVIDGLWFSYGDGQFLPSGTSTGIFSTTVQYQPGPQEIADGEFNLILVSDDPDGNGPMVEISDQVLISFMNSPALVCNSSINVSLADACTQAVDIFMLVANPTAPYDKYIIELLDENDNIVIDNLLTVDHLDQTITFSIGHDCTSNICEGTIYVSDNIAPFLNCTNLELECNDDLNPTNTGFPIPFYATATSSGINTYTVTQLDACGDVTLSYLDTEEEQECTTGYIQKTTRIWTAIDQSGNSSSCNQELLLRPLLLDSVLAPSNYNDIDNPVLSCEGNWIELDDGHPSPESTGNPSDNTCSNIQSTFNDIEFELCGAGFKVLRQWTVIDWCTTQSIGYNQIIMVSDNEGPVFLCPEDIELSVEAYECTILDYTLSYSGQVNDCSDYDFGFQIFNINGQNISAQNLDENVLSGLTIGTYIIKYIATDVCGNASDCSVTLTVIDDSPPFAICDGFTSVSVSSNGVATLFANSLDDGSFDNCSPITVEIAKMTDQCGWGLNFGPKIHLCCDEFADSIIVAFRVTDDQGLSNICMSTVYIEDNIPPEITCPSDITIACTYNYDINDLSPFGIVVENQANINAIIYNGNIVGQDGYYFDNCNATVVENITENIDCGVGTITRLFTVTDSYGQSVSCTQIITIENNTPFTQSEIQWPINYMSSGCDTIQAEPSITGVPTYIDIDNCAMIASTYEDQVFNISGEACIKIIRTWQVIDWCQFNANTQSGLWTYIQEIKLINNIAPTFLGCEAIEICNYNNNCEYENVTLSTKAIDDCTDSLLLQYSWKLDIDNDNNIDFTGTGNQVTKELSLGSHHIYWTVADGCGNQSTCEHDIYIKDCKNPTPYCQSSITSTLMPSSGSIEIWAKDYNYGSYDNCTLSEDLIFSFSKNTSDSSKIITCADIPNGIAAEIELEMWVTDQSNNQERCFITFAVQDNGMVCDDGEINGKISGKIATQKGKPIPNVELDYSCIIDEYSGFEMTDSIGNYTIYSTPEYLKYVLKPEYSSSFSSGVSTLDLVMIQQHILEVKLFDNPYDIIASDVSGNKKVSSSDLIIMRKMILGIILEWPKNQAAWTFIDSSYVFYDWQYPFNYPDSIVLNKLIDSVQNVNFVAIKRGDINGSFKPINAKNTSKNTTRQIESIQLKLEKKYYPNGSINTIAKVDYENQSLNRMNGIQLSIDIPDNTTFESDILSPEDYIITNNQLKIAWTNPNQLDITHLELFSLTYTDDINFSLNNSLLAEGYINMEPISITLDQSLVEDSAQNNNLRPMLIPLNNPFT